MVAGDAFVIGDGLVVDEGAVGVVRYAYGDAAGAAAVGCAGLIVGGDAGLIGGDGFDGDGAVGQDGEELRELGLHLRNVVAEGVEDLFFGLGGVLGVVLDGVAEGGEVFVAGLVGDVGHLGGDALDLVEADLMDLRGCEVGGGLVADGDLVAVLAVGEGGDADGGAAVGGVVVGDELGEGGEGGVDLGCDYLLDGGGEALTVGVGEAGGHLFDGVEEGLGGDDVVDLGGDFFEDEARGHEVIFHAEAQDFGGLGEDAGDLVEAGYVVLVVLDGVEGDGVGEVGEGDVDALLLVDGHLVVLEVEGLDALLELALHELVGEEILVGEAGGVDGGEADEVGLVLGVLRGDAGERVVGELVVVAVVADGGGALGGVLEAGLPLVFEEGVLGGDAVGYGGLREGEGGR